MGGGRITAFQQFEIIDVYSQEQAIADGIIVKVGVLKPVNLSVLFTTNLFEEVKGCYKEIIDKGLKLLSKPDKEDSPYLKLRVIEDGKIWVVAKAEGVTFMKPEDY